MLHHCTRLVVRRSTLLLLASALSLASFASAHAQTPFQNGLSVRKLADGLLVPLQMGRDSLGNVYFGSGWYDPVTKDKVKIFRLAPDGTLSTLKDPVSDPDALAVGPDDAVYCGAYDGRILRVDPVTGKVTIWLQHLDLGNIDGLEFFGSSLYTVAFDTGKVHVVDFPTKTFTKIADLAPFGFVGLTGVARHPEQPRLYLTSPSQGVVLELDEDGTLLDPAFATGFDFPGHVEFDPRDPTGRFLYLADNGGGAIHRIDTETREVELVVHRFDQTGGLFFDAEGRLLFTSSLDDGSRGEVWRAEAISLRLEGGDSGRPNRDPVRAVLDSPADTGREVTLLASLDGTGQLLPGGRWLPLGPTGIVRLGTMLPDADGFAELDLDDVLSDPSLAGMALNFCAVSHDPDRPRLRHGISAPVLFTTPDDGTGQGRAKHSP